MSAAGASAKVLLLGPTKSGKTTLANFLADAKDSIGQYRPTVGCRIVEFQLDSTFNGGGSKGATAASNNNNTGRDIQMWDCSGDPKYHNCLPALASETVAVLLMYDMGAEAHVAELEELYKVWSNYLDLSPSRYLVVARKWQADGDGGGSGTHQQPSANKMNKRSNNIKMGTLARLSRVEWDIDTEGPKVQSEFASFINAALIDLKRSRDEQEITILKE